jgi:hypothetical protein
MVKVLDGPGGGGYRGGAAVGEEEDVEPAVGFGLEGGQHNVKGDGCKKGDGQAMEHLRRQDKRREAHRFGCLGRRVRGPVL